MMTYDILLFDLDGTLTDPAEGITNSVMHALRKWGIEVSDRRELYCFIGPPLVDSFMKYYGFSREDAERSVEYYREYFRDRGLFENTVYPDTAETLGALKKMGKKLVVATSKPEVFAKRILEHFELDGFFDLIVGATLDSSRVKKGDVIAYALEAFGISDRSRCLMIGDREHDILGAKDNEIASVGVLCGYGDRAELSAAGADFIVENLGDILSLDIL